MFDQIKKLKLILHKDFYNPNTIQSLIDNFQNAFDLFSIDYDDTTKIIQMKIKKTSMKKIPNYSHSSLFYYSIINPIMMDFFNRNISIDNLDPQHIETMSMLGNSHHVSMLYSVIVIGDNIVNIQL